METESSSLVLRCVEAAEPQQEAVGVQKPETSLQLVQQVCEDVEKVCERVTAGRVYDVI